MSPSIRYLLGFSIRPGYPLLYISAFINFPSVIYSSDSVFRLEASATNWFGISSILRSAISSPPNFIRALFKFLVEIRDLN